MGIAFRVVISPSKSGIDINTVSANGGRVCVFCCLSPTLSGRGAVSYTTGFPEDWRNHAFG